MTTALVVGNMIGAGMFLLPAALAPYGMNAVIGWLITIAGALCLAFVLAELPARDRGGPYAYTREAFGPTAGLHRDVELLDLDLDRERGHRHRRHRYLSRLVPAINASPAMAAATSGRR